MMPKWFVTKMEVPIWVFERGDRPVFCELEREAIRRVAIGAACPKPVLHNALSRARRKIAA